MYTYTLQLQATTKENWQWLLNLRTWCRYWTSSGILSSWEKLSMMWDV